jgi:poly(beta-D-mannuronate) lyase
VGVSQHCEFNSNTRITGNFFEHCDGETEIISIKSGGNMVRNNFFKECQGTVVLRHGNFNTVENNIFAGNNKPGTGGVRIINKGQWVVNNLFYQCRGDGFRSPMAIMNGVPNSPAHRYVAVTDAVVANNSFADCTPMSFCEGSDAERSVPPKNVFFINNIFYNTKDSILYQVHDSINGIFFANNQVSRAMKAALAEGFVKTGLQAVKTASLWVPVTKVPPNNTVPDSLQSIATQRLLTPLSSTPGFRGQKNVPQLTIGASQVCGAAWFRKKEMPVPEKVMKLNCKNAAEVVAALGQAAPAKLEIVLTGREYLFGSAININKDVQFTGPGKTSIQFSYPAAKPGFFILLKAGYTLSFNNLTLDVTGITATSFISTDTAGSCEHSALVMTSCNFYGLTTAFFNAAKTSVLDSIVLNRCAFTNMKGGLLSMTEETDKKGYYNAEQIKITNSRFTNIQGPLLAVIRSGTDESTMGPRFHCFNNSFSNCSASGEALIYLYGVQYSLIEKNSFRNCNAGSVLLQYEDAVKAAHVFRKNTLQQSGMVKTNPFVRVE